MKYGYFDETAREYVITNPDTPAPWANYLGSPAYGAIVTVNAGGYSFVKSGAAGRIIRYMFNQFDEPGRYIYLRDDETGDFGRPHGSPSKSRLTSTRPSATTARPTQSSSASIAASARRRCTTSPRTPRMRFGICASKISPAARAS